MNKKKIISWGIVLLIGLMLTGCAGYYGGYGYYDYPYYGYYDYGYPFYGYYGYPYYGHHYEWGEHHHDRH